MSSQAHWEAVYQSREGNEVSWYRPHLEVSLRLVAEAAPGAGSAIIDVGGGEATLVDDLVARGYSDVTVLDISQAAIDVAKARLGRPPPPLTGSPATSRRPNWRRPATISGTTGPSSTS